MRARISKRNEGDRARRIQKRNITLAEESYPERVVRLEHLSAFQKQRLAAEAPEERVARLEHLSALQCLAAEASEERVARLERLSALQ